MFTCNVLPGIHLRIFEDRDAGPLFAACDANREHLRRFLPWVGHTRSSADWAAFISTVLDQFANNLGFHAGIWSQDQIIGAAGMHPIDWPNSNVSLGYWIAEPWQGKGIITQCVKLLTSHCFATLGLQRVEIRCSTDNRRSQAVPERLGFRYEGTLRAAQKLPNGFTDIRVYSRLRTDES